MRKSVSKAQFQPWEGGSVNTCNSLIHPECPGTPGQDFSQDPRGVKSHCGGTLCFTSILRPYPSHSRNRRIGPFRFVKMATAGLENDRNDLAPVMEAIIKLSLIHI